MSPLTTPGVTYLPVRRKPPGVDVSNLAAALLADARVANHRRMLVLAGDRDAGESLASDALEAIDVPIAETIAMTPRDCFQCERRHPDRSAELMGTTYGAIVLDLQYSTDPNLIGRAIGAVDGGGIAIVLCPSLETWPNQRDAFDEGLVVEPFELADVRGGFKRRLRTCLRTHPGSTVVDVDAGRISDRTPAPTGPSPSPPGPSIPTDPIFPVTAYQRCRTRDQSTVLEDFERMTAEPGVIVVSADRGRGKSSVGGLAAGSFANRGNTVLVTAPEPSNVRALFARAGELVTDAPVPPSSTIRTESGGSVAYDDPAAVAAAAASEAADVIIVDEAAGVPVRTLERTLACDRVACLTTRHGYEGSGHGFAIRFRDHLDSLDRPIVDRTMQTPIRYAPHDPLESFVNRLLVLDARPPVPEAIDGAAPETCDPVHLEPQALERDDERLREVLGLLAAAHYRTEPNDLARVLDAPNLYVHALQTEGRIVSVALVALEGNLPESRVMAAYRGERLRGNMLPDVLCSSCRHRELPGEPGLRIVRLATHQAVRRRGLGSALLAAIRDHYRDTIEWMGTGFGATSGTVQFWTGNGFRPILLSASRNRASGAHSAIFLDAEFGEAPQVEALAAEFPARLRDSLSDVHDTADPDVVRELLAAAPTVPVPELSDEQWRRLVAAADGPGRYGLDPGPARDLILTGLTDPSMTWSPDRETLLIEKILQGAGWDELATTRELPVGILKRHVGEALGMVLDRYGNDTVAAERALLTGEDPSSQR